MQKMGQGFHQNQRNLKVQEFKLVPNGQIDPQKNCEFQKLISYANSRLRMLTFFLNVPNSTEV